MLEGGSGRQWRAFWRERGREPLRKRPADALDDFLGAERAELTPDSRVNAQVAIQLQGPTVMREGSHQHGADRFAVAVVPGQEVVPPQGVEEPLCSRVVLIREYRNQLAGVPNPAKRGGQLPTWKILGPPDPCLETHVRFANVV